MQVCFYLVTAFFIILTTACEVSIENEQVSIADDSSSVAQNEDDPTIGSSPEILAEGADPEIAAGGLEDSSAGKGGSEKQPMVLLDTPLISAVYNLGGARVSIDFNPINNADSIRLYYGSSDSELLQSYVELQNSGEIVEFGNVWLNQELAFELQAFSNNGESLRSERKFSHTTTFVSFPANASTPISNVHFFAAAFDDNTYYLATYADGLLIKRPSEVNFERITSAQGILGREAFAIDAAAKNVVVSGQSDIHLSTDNGASFRKIHDDSLRQTMFFPNKVEIQGDKIYWQGLDSAYLNGSVYITNFKENLAQSWLKIDDTYTSNQLNSGEAVNSFCVLNDTVVLLTGEALIVTTNDGQTWERHLHGATDPIRVECRNSAAEISQAFILTESNGFRIATDLSDPVFSEIPSSTPNFPSGVCRYFGFALDKIIVSCSETSGSFAAHFGVSDDDGATWTSYIQEVAFPDVWRLSISNDKVFLAGDTSYTWNGLNTPEELIPKDSINAPVFSGDRVFSGRSSNVFWLSDWDEGVLRSTDYQSWELINPEPSRTNAQNAYAAYTFNGFDIIGSYTGLYHRPVGNTGSWTRQLTARTYQVVQYEDNYFVATNSGLYTFDADWNQLSHENNSVGLGDSMAISVSTDGTSLWVAHRNGVAKRPLTGGAWQVYNITDGLINNASYQIVNCGDLVVVSPERWEQNFDKGLSVSKNGGVSWEALDTGYFNRDFQAIYCDGSEFWASGTLGEGSAQDVIMSPNMLDASPEYVIYNYEHGAATSHRNLPNMGFSRDELGFWIHGSYHFFLKPD